jgi:hypothetical protein
MTDWLEMAYEDRFIADIDRDEEEDMPDYKPNDYPPNIVPRAATWLPKEDCE